MLDINPGLILWTIITFLVVLVILRAVAWKPLLQRAHVPRGEDSGLARSRPKKHAVQAQTMLEENQRQLAAGRRTIAAHHQGGTRRWASN